MATAPPPSQQQQQPFSTWTTNATQEILDSSIASKASKDIVADDNETPENRSGHTAANKHPTEDQSFDHDTHGVMNIHHFEQLMVMFNEHKNEDGSGGFTIDKFREVFGQVLGKRLSFDQMTMLFMKIDANSDGTVDWDEFTGYMMVGSMEDDDINSIFDDRIRRLISCPHKDMIKRIDFIPKERKYISVGRDGVICLWSQNLKLQKIINTKEFYPQMSWVLDALFLHDYNKLAIVTDDRQLCVYDILSIKPRLLATVAQLEYNPLCLGYASRYDENRDLILYGDDGGYVNVLSITRKFLVDSASSADSDSVEALTPAKISKKDSLRMNNISLYRRKIHNDWVLKVQFYTEINAFVSCSTDSTKSLVIGDLERKTIRPLVVPKGINCFDFCRRPSFLVTGGRDKIIRLWNPYVLSKPAGSLSGHSTAIVSIKVNHDEGHIISLSDDKVIKVWNARNLNCLQTLMDKVPHRPENILSAMFFDNFNRQLITGSTKLESWPLYKNVLKQAVTRSHSSAVVGAMFNENFHQVVSGCQNGTVTIWDISTGQKIFQYLNAHGEYELTTMGFDTSGRRLVTGSRDGLVKMWNFNNGQIISQMVKDNDLEVTGIEYVEMGTNKYVVVVGWDRKITIFLDDGDNFESGPVRVLNGGGTSVIKGHEDDLTSVAFCAPNTLATSSVDGIILIWNMESGILKYSLKEPFLDLRSKEEKAIEKILFLHPETSRRSGHRYRIPLVSCHADGYLRFWDTYDGTLVYEMHCQASEDEGLNVLAFDKDAQLLLLGGSKGHVRVFDVQNFQIRADREDYTNGCVLKTNWRAHTHSITSVNYVKTNGTIITSSSDSTIRVWTMDGFYIGAFGQETPWVIGNPSSYSPLPTDVKTEVQIETQRALLLQSQKEALKKNVLDTWRGIAIDIQDNSATEDSPGQLNLKLHALRTRTIQTTVLEKWKAFCAIRKISMQWEIQPELLVHKNSKNFFSFESQLKLRSAKAHHNNKVVSHDAVYHFLECHPLEDIQHKLPNAAHKGGKVLAKLEGGAKLKHFK